MTLAVERAFWTKAATADVFAYLADFRNTVEWDPGTVRCDLVVGPVGAGATYRNVSRFGGRSVELTYVTVQHEPDRELHFQGRNGSFVGHDRLHFRRSGSGTAVQYRAEFEFQGLARVAVPFVSLYLPRLADRTIQQLRGVLDTL